MNIEEANQLIIKNTFGDLNDRGVSGSSESFRVNRKLVSSLIEYRNEFGPPTDVELNQHHTSTLPFIKTTNCN